MRYVWLPVHYFCLSFHDSYIWTCKKTNYLMNLWYLNVSLYFSFLFIFGCYVISFCLLCYRYKKLLRTVDLTKDFFFSYSYHVMRSIQKNMCESETSEHALYDTMFVWNEFLTRGIRNILQNTLWTVALVYGFFHQVIFH